MVRPGHWPARRLNWPSAGDLTAIRLCLERIAPPRKDGPVNFKLPPVKTAGDAANAAGAIVSAVAAGDLTPVEGGRCMVPVEKYCRALETAELERRVVALEEAAENRG